MWPALTYRKGSAKMAKHTLYDEDGNPVEVEIAEQDNDNGPAQLRRALKKEQAERAAERAELEALKARVRATEVEGVLTAKGVPGKIAKFIPSDIATPDQINQWLVDNADVFGFQHTTQSDPLNEERKEAASQFQRINAATETAIPASNIADLTARINNPNLSKADLDAITGVQGNMGSGRRAY